ncbi:MAG: GIY-YIG nuclease family protein [Candidatus Latescibacteria bacterium]|nr:GIY-YIG nuclease family protein [Candidatus Latescibacterota bacterium]
MDSSPGTYIIVMRSGQEASLQIRSWGRIELRRGWYIYVGSAFGPGGIRARVSRHFREDKAKHWHIDDITALARPQSAWFSVESQRLEHTWATVCQQSDEFTAVRGFGCSDCTCYSHLFFAGKEPSLGQFTDKTGSDVQIWRPERDV